MVAYFGGHVVVRLPARASLRGRHLKRKEKGVLGAREQALVDNTLLGLQNSSYPTQPRSIIANYYQSLYIGLLAFLASKVYLIKKGTPRGDLMKVPSRVEIFLNVGFQEKVWTYENGNLRK